MEVVDGEGVFVGRAYLTARRGCGDALHTRVLPDPRKAVGAVRRPLPRAGDVPEGAIGWRRAASSIAWPMFGRPRLLVADSAKEFKGRAFQRGCEDYGIRIRYRDRGRVHEGGVVERLLGKLNAVLAMHPGSTGRSVADRDGYPAQRRARLSFADLERCVALAVIDHNLQQNAKTLKTPAAEWAHCSRGSSAFRGRRGAGRAGVPARGGAATFAARRQPVRFGLLFAMAG